MKGVPAFDIADVIQGTLLKQLVGFFHQDIALPPLFTDTEEADPGAIMPEEYLRKSRGHDPELEEMLGAAINICAHIHHHHRTFQGRENTGDPRPGDMLQAAKQLDGRCQCRPGIAGADNSINPALFVEGKRLHDGGVFFLADGVKGGFIHADNLGGMHQMNPGRRSPMGCQNGPKQSLVTDQADLKVRLARSQDCPGNQFPRASVPAHGIQGNMQCHGAALLLFGQLDNRTTLVCPATRTKTVRQLRLATLGAGRNGYTTQRIVGTTDSGTAMGMSSFR
ncbi:MAG: hypothetical protein ACD_74C00076G0002 [uncultured bacterium]|nr:MAG: hypothetical protein ACD_74C00076G0002 [uncultured bacterium]